MRASTIRGYLRGLAQQPLYPWLLAIYPIALIAVLNRSQVDADGVLLVLLGGVLAASGCVALYRPLLGAWHKAALCAAVTIALFYAFGPVSMALQTWLEQSEREDTPLLGLIVYRAPLLLSALWLIGLIVTAAVVRGVREQRIAGFAKPLNLVTGLLVAAVVGQYVAGAATHGRAAFASAQPTPTLPPRESLPDIYYIILDGYARADVLAQYYGYDNSPFLDALRSQGFAVNDRGFANYNWTFLSLASSLNMGYLPAVLGDSLDPTSTDREAAYESIRDSAVAQTLRSDGYRFIQLQSTWGATLRNPYADELISCGGNVFAQEFFRTFAEASWLRALTARASASLAICHTNNFASLAAVAAEPDPKFVFAHFLLPHHPYLFDRHGNVLHDATIANQFDFQARLWEKRAGYLEQLQYVNGAVLTAIASIRATSPRPPVIVLQSDHGPQLIDGLTESEQRRVRLANLAAFHLPGAPHDLIPQGDSPVNFFRRILNFYVGSELPPLANRHFYSPYGLPFAVVDVTATVAEEPQVLSAGGP